MSHKILITGGAGFVGSNIIRYILGKYSDYRVINFDTLTASASLDRLNTEDNNPQYTFVRGDISKEKDVQYVFEQYKPDYIIHLAAQSYIDKSIHQPSIFIETNVIGTQLILANAREHKIAKMVHLSTSKVYGTFQENVLIDENSSLKPYDPYAASKAAADMFVMAAHRSKYLNVNIIRPINVYGDYQFPEKLIPTVIESCLHNKNIPVYGTGESYRDWLYVNDFCKAVDLVLHKGEAGQVYNISFGESIKNIEVVKTIINRMGADSSRITYLQERLGDESYPTISSKRIQEELGWKPKVDIDQGIELTIDWFKKHSEWVEEIYSGDYQIANNAEDQE